MSDQKIIRWILWATPPQHVQFKDMDSLYVGTYTETTFNFEIMFLPY
jgi:hypothetical protein